MGRVSKWCAGWALHLFWVAVDIAMRLHFRLKGTCLLPLLADPYCSTRVMYSSNSDPKSIAMFENCSGCSGCSVQTRLSCILLCAAAAAAALLQHCKVKQCREWVHWDLLVVRGDSCWVLLVRHRATLALSRTGGITFYVSSQKLKCLSFSSLCLLSLCWGLSLSRFSARLRLQF